MFILSPSEAHVAATVKGGTLSAAPDLLRPLFETTIVNLDSSQSESVSFRNLPLDLPFSFFLNNDLLGNVLEIDLSGLGTIPTVARRVNSGPSRMVRSGITSGGNGRDLALPVVPRAMQLLDERHAGEG